MVIICNLLTSNKKWLNMHNFPKENLQTTLKKNIESQKQRGLEGRIWEGDMVERGEERRRLLKRGEGR